MFRFLLIAWCVIFCALAGNTQRKYRKAKARSYAKSPATVSHFPLKISKNDRYLTDQLDKPFLLNADAGWLLFQKLRIEDARFYLAKRKAKYFNAVFVQLLPPEPNEHNAYGEVPFIKQGDFSTPNEKYFRHVEDVLLAANRLGMAVAIVPAWLGCCRTNRSEERRVGKEC